MTAFFKDYEKFYGTGQKDEQGRTLDEFLESYDTSKYETPSNTVDTLVFAGKDRDVKKGLRILLIKRRNHPSIGYYALPGGFVEMRENLMDAALRELKEETGVDNIEVEQLATYGDYKRDPRTRVITTAYVAYVNEDELKVEAGDDAAYAGWFNVSEQLIDSEEYVDNGQRKIKELHRLTLFEDGKEEIYADVLVRYNKEGILKNKTYEVVKTDKIAVDHGAIILNGYHRIMGM